MNEYGYVVIRKGNIPLHIVEIRHEMYVGFNVFSNAKDATSFINKEKETLSGLTYNPDFKFSNGLITEYQNRKRLFSKITNRQIYAL